MKVPEPRKMSSGNYYIQLRLGGVSIPVTAPTAAECKRQAALIKAEHLNGKRIASTTPTEDKPLGALIDDYISSKDNILSPGTLRGYDIIRRNRFKTYMNKPVKNLNFQKMINDEKKVCSDKTIKNAWGLVSATMKYHNVQVPTNLTLPNSKMIKRKQKLQQKWLTPEEIKIFVNAVKTEKWGISALLALHSLRRSEIYAVAETNGIDLKAGVIHVRGAVVNDREHKLVYKESNKTDASTRDVPIMIPELAEMYSQGYPITDGDPKTLLRRIKKLCADLGITVVTTHGLRHSFASLCFHLGWPEEQTMRVGGWGDAGIMREIYTHLYEVDNIKFENTMTDFYAK